MLKDDHGNFADFRFVYLNRALARLEGFDADYVNGKCFYKLMKHYFGSCIDFSKVFIQSARSQIIVIDNSMI